MAGEDKFANYAIISVTESAANTLTFKKLETAISLNEKVAWIVSRLEYITDSLDSAIMNASGDGINFGLSVSNAFATPAINEITIIDFNTIARIDIGAAASGMFTQQPLVKDFSMLPNGGIILPPNPIYLFAKGSGLTAATSLTLRMYYTTRQLKVDEYWELVEARRVLES